MSNYKSSVLLISSFFVALFGLAWAASVEQREMPGSSAYGQGGYDQGGYNQVSGSYGQQGPPPQYGAMPSYGANNPYTNPGISVQTGFEGFLVPNSWYGLLPWGVEGVVVVIVGVIVFLVIVAGLVGLLAWLTGFGDYAIVKESARNLFSKNMKFETIADITNSVLDALDKYDEINQKKNY